jgi:hypothetical protein
MMLILTQLCQIRRRQEYQGLPQVLRAALRMSRGSQFVASQLHSFIGTGDCNAAVTAIYIEQNDKTRRTNIFVISGLPTDDQESDNDLAQQLCFGQSVDVLSLKRLGQPQQMVTQPRHPRRLLVHIKSRDQAQIITPTARRLRESSKAEYMSTN